eukprot:COSAG01_NODE_3310_length_6282_cov_2.911693_9_plen_174_part_00
MGSGSLDWMGGRRPDSLAWWPLPAGGRRQLRSCYSDGSGQTAHTHQPSSQRKLSGVSPQDSINTPCMHWLHAETYFQVIDVPAHEVVDVLHRSAARGDGAEVAAQSKSLALPAVISARAVAHRGICGKSSGRLEDGQSTGRRTASNSVLSCARGPELRELYSHNPSFRPFPCA